MLEKKNSILLIFAAVVLVLAAGIEARNGGDQGKDSRGRERVNRPLGGVGQMKPDETTVQDAIDNIASALEFKDKIDTVRSILSGSKLIKSFAQPVAGINRTFLLKTKRGYECFRIYNSFTGENHVNNYARGDKEEEVMESCRSFFELPPPEVHVAKFLSEANSASDTDSSL